MDATLLAKIVTLVVLIGIFVATVLATPRIWSSNQVKGQDKGAARSPADAGVTQLSKPRPPGRRT